MYALNRRNFIKLIGATGLGLTSVGVSGLAEAAGSMKQIKVAGVGPLSGAYAQAGIDMLNAAAIESKDMGNLLGRPIDYVKLDTKLEVAQARRLVTEAMNQKNTKFFFGGASSAVALAVAAVTNQNRGVFITGAGADEITGKDCTTSTFRWSLPTYGAVRETVLPLIKENPKLKRWYTITPNYVFGQSLLKNCKQVLKEQGLELVGNSFHSLSETDFTSYIENAIAAKPDVLVLLNFGSQSTTTLKEAISYGIKSRMKVLTVWAAGLDQYEALGADAMDGLYFGCQYWHGIDTPVNKMFVKSIKDATGAPPNYPMSLGFVGFELLKLGMTKANSTDPVKVIKALEGLKYEGLTGEETIRAADHQAIKQYYLLKGKPKGKMKDKFDYVDIVSHGSSLIPLKDSACKLRAFGS